ncbi:MAG: hypothetical protein M3P06_14035 [Acidobacteriota bacterium]|nr:hypothetical protein [Acidobacteriota bacterium]
MPSYEDINYALRPAKTIERKMLADAFHRLSAFASLTSYRYVGFGSTYFSDFILFHRALGITNMLSIEKDKSNAGRFEFNVPFDCVKMAYGRSTEVLPTLKWKTRTIAWLDYDGPLSADVLADVAFFAANAGSGSVLVVSVNANVADDDADEPSADGATGVSVASPEAKTPQAAAERRLHKFKSRVGHTKVPATITSKDMRKWGIAEVSKRIITNEITETLRARNGALQSDDRVSYSQLFNFHYADRAKMLTVGGVIYAKREEPRFLQALFEELDFVRMAGDAYSIEVPNLTYREIRSLEKQMPCGVDSALYAPGIPNVDVQKYARVYRFFPTFAETDA